MDLEKRSKPPFPTPRELSEKERNDLEPDVVRLRKLVHEAFKDGRTSSGAYSLKKPHGTDHIPQAAYDIVQAELEESGWVVEPTSNYGGSYWLISEKTS